MTTTVLLSKERVKLPPLENGDRLTRPEFERRYQAMTHIKKAELIEGVVYMGSPVRVRSHGTPHACIMVWLGNYWIATPGVNLGDNATVRLDSDNEPQPDALLRKEEGGQSSISSDDYIEGAPELIVEIATSSAAYDLGNKLNAYRRNGVQEYIVWQIYDRRIDWFRWKEGAYVKLEPDTEGILKSEVFPGLWLGVKPLLEGNLTAVLAILQSGLETAEHQVFVRKLAF